MKAIRIFIILLLLAIQPYTNAQAAIKPLKIGDKVPDIMLSNMINYKSKQAHISDFKGKYIILDFWNVECLACISAFPEMGRLQREFDGKLQVLLVTNNTVSQANHLFKYSTNVKTSKLPFVIGNTYLYKLFPHKAEPFHVWIDKNGIIRAITDGYNATSANVGLFTEGAQLHLNIRKDWDLTRYSEYATLLDIIPKDEYGNIEYYSMVTKYFPGLKSSGIGLLTDSLTHEAIGMDATGCEIRQLFQLAYRFEYRLDRIILEFPHAEDYIFPTNLIERESWRDRFSFNYESKFPESDHGNVQKFRTAMQQDLWRYFGIVASREKRKLMCWVITLTKPRENTPASGERGLVEKSVSGYSIQNASISLLSDYIVSANMGINARPVVDETGYSGTINMDINAEFNDLPRLRPELNKNGMDIVEAEREIEVLVLKKSNNE